MHSFNGGRSLWAFLLFATHYGYVGAVCLDSIDSVLWSQFLQCAFASEALHGEPYVGSPLHPGDQLQWQCHEVSWSRIWPADSC